jgi:AraC-like DNA-binding protein
MSFIDNFLNGREVFRKYIVDTVNEKYIETNYYDTEYFARVCKKTLGLEYREYSTVLNPTLPQFFCATTSVKLGTQNQIFGGKSFAYDEARSKCIGEYIERISSHQEWGGKKHKRLFCRSLISPLGYSFFDRDQVYWGGERRAFGTVGKTQTTTNGCAGYFTKDGAIVGAMLELIQRDGFIVYWLNTISPKKIDVDTFVKELQLKDPQDLSQKEKDLIKLIDKLKKHNISYYFLDITTDIKVPSVCAVASIELNGETNYVIGAASGFDASSTLLSACFESMTGLSRLFSKEVFVLPDDYKPFSDKAIDLEKRTQIYRCKKNNVHFEFFIASKEMISIDDWLGGLEIHKTEKEQRKYIENIFREKARISKDFIPYFYVFNNKLLKELNYFVVRVICKGLYSIYLNEQYGDPSHPRLAQFVKDCGYAHIAKPNIWPHPFP